MAIAEWPPVRGVALQVDFVIRATTAPFDPVVDPQGLSARVKKDTGVEADSDNTPAVAAAVDAIGSLLLSAAEMSANKVSYWVKSSSGSDFFGFFYPKEIPSPTLQAVECVVDAGASVTSIPTSSQNPASSVTDQWKGRIVIFKRDTTTAALRGQATDITANTAGGTLTVTALTTVPVAGDSFIIV